METGTAPYRVRIGAWVKARLMRNPAALKVQCDGLDLFVVRDVLSRAECDRIIALIDANLTPSKLLSPSGDPEFRTSRSCNLDPHHPQVVALEKRLREVIGISTDMSETVQGQRYGVGEQFKPHFDFFFEDQPYWPELERTGGQRTWTAMLFLNDVEGGGHTAFPEAEVSIRPRAGNLVAWNNLTPEGGGNPRALHQGSPVTAGCKYVITKWYRERPWTPTPDVPLY